MGRPDRATKSVYVSAENIGGITKTQISFKLGVTVLSGRNTTNRTSFLQAIMAGLGSENVSLRREAENGSVQLSIDGEIYTRMLEREGGDVRMSGDPYLEDSLVADLFAFLLESNEARKAVTHSEDLSDIIMRPVDTEEIQSKISELIDERDRIDSQLNQVDALEERLTELIELRTQITEEIGEKENRLESVHSEIESFDVENPQTKQSQLETKMSCLNESQTKLRDIEYDIETEQQRQQSLIEEKTQIEREIKDTPDTSGEKLARINHQIENLRSKNNKLDENITSLQEVIQFNREMLTGDGLDLIGELVEQTDSNFLTSVRRQGSVDLLGALRNDYNTSGSVTNKLTGKSQVTCWTCGSTVRKDQVHAILENLQKIRTKQLEMQDEVEEELNELKEEANDIKSRKRALAEKKSRCRELQSDLQNSEEKIKRLRKRREDAENEREAIKAEIEELRSENHSEIIDTHKKANELEVDLNQLWSEQENIEEEISSIEEQRRSSVELEERKDEITNELTELRTKVERIQKEAISAFNQHMDEVLGVLEYDNIDCIWIERLVTGSDDDQDVTFSLHIVREGSSGEGKEDTIDHLSESEREVTGIVFALAGYLVHEVYETVPFMLLDSVEAIDSERIAGLVSYLSGFVPYLVVALLPEDAKALDNKYQYIHEI